MWRRARLGSLLPSHCERLITWPRRDNLAAQRPLVDVNYAVLGRSLAEWPQAVRRSTRVIPPMNSNVNSWLSTTAGTVSQDYAIEVTIGPILLTPHRSEDLRRRRAHPRRSPWERPFRRLLRGIQGSCQKSSQQMVYCDGADQPGRADDGAKCRTPFTACTLPGTRCRGAKRTSSLPPAWDGHRTCRAEGVSARRQSSGISEIGIGQRVALAAPNQ